MTVSIDRPAIDIAAAAAYADGRAVVVLHGDGGLLVAAAERVTTATMALLVRIGTGFVQVALPEPVCDRLRLPPMAWPLPPGSRGEQCVSVDASAGVTTGISAADRTRTARILAAPDTAPGDLTRPGHVIPLRIGAGRSSAASALQNTTAAGYAAAVVSTAVSLRDPRSTADADDLIGLALRHDLPVVDERDGFRR